MTASARSRLKRLQFFLAAASWIGSGAAWAQHRALLPQPRQLIYGEGRLRLAGIRIRLEPNPTAEDRFAGSTLAGCIGLATHAKVPLLDRGGSGPEIVLRRTGALDPLPAPGETPGPDSRESYSIHVSADGAAVDARSSAGVFYGVQTVCQMIEDPNDPALPAARIHDWPASAYRGVLVDMSEGPLLRVSEIENQIDLLARWKINQYYFYNETTIALRGLPPAAPGARIAISDVRAIAEYARERHIDLVPALELYGHLHDLFRREQFSDLADFPHGVEFNPDNPQVARLIGDWVNQYVAIFHSPFVHVGFDETWQLQQAAQKGDSSPADLFVQQLRKVSGLFQQRGKTVLAWADIMVKYPDTIAKLPPGIIAVPWFYDPRPDPQYTRWLAPLIEHRVPFMVAPGVNGWNEIAPDYNLTFRNIDTFIKAGRAGGSMGVIDTIWSDDVQMLKPPVSPGMAYGGAASWQSQPVQQETFFAEYAAIEYPPAIAPWIASGLRKMADSESALQLVLGQDTMLRLWRSPFDATLLRSARQGGGNLRRSRLLAEGAEEDFLRAIDAGADAAKLESYLVECRLLDYAGLKFQYGVEIADAWNNLGPHPTAGQLENDFDNLVTSQQHGKLADLMEMITALEPQYKQAWLDEYTVFRLEAALGRWRAEYEYWRRLQANLQDVVDEYNPKAGLPAFASLLPRD